MRFLSKRRQSPAVKLSRVLLASTLSLLALHPPAYSDAIPAAPVPIIYSGHENAVQDVDFSRDGRLLVSGSPDGIRVWDLETGAILQDVRPNFGSINKLKLLRDGRTALASFANGALANVNIETGQVKQIAPPKPAASAVRYGKTVLTPDEQTLVSKVDQRFIEVRSAKSGKRLELIEPSKFLTAQAFPELNSPVPAEYAGSQASTTQFEIDDIALSPDGRYLAMGGGLSRSIKPLEGNYFPQNFNSPIFLWDMKAHKLARTFRTGPNPVLSVTFSRNGTLLAAANAESNSLGQSESMVHLWNVQTGEALPAITDGNSVPHVLEFSWDNQWLAASSFDGNPWARNLQTGERLSAFHSNLPGALVLRAAPDGNTWVTGHSDGELLLHSTQTTFGTRQLNRDAGPDAPMAVSPDRRRLVTTRGGAMHVWNLERGMLERTIQSGRDWWQAAAVSADAKFAVVALRTRATLSTQELQFWDLDSGQTRSWDTIRGEITGITISPDNTRVAVAWNSRFTGSLTLEGSKSTVSMLDAKDGKKIWSNEDAESKVGGLTFSPNGAWLAGVHHFPNKVPSKQTDLGFFVGSPRQTSAIRMLDARTGKLQKEIAKSVDLTSVPSFSPDGNQLLTIGSGQPRIWNTQDGALVAVIPTHCVTAMLLPENYIATQRLNLAVGNAGTDNYWQTSTECKFWKLGPLGPIEMTNLEGLQLPFVFNNNRLFAATSNAGTRLMNPSPVTFITREAGTPGAETQWLIYTPDGYYTGSEGIEKFMRWPSKGKFISGDTFKTSRRRPEEVQRRLNTAPENTP